ncbi:alpha/beta hydrolase [Rhodococcus sp. HM1]|uniref:alpha/beta hydrolase n=1 Tax=Rhodococcus sp. HM1 TaxID=2937759 RepID=UPI00200A5D6B|nr:alpha/beta hydrolase [Rhodococcus sp. HM1]MCK8671685.1 alpha/beta hydrolase [Rhodococcus sp. HM1]
MRTHGATVWHWSISVKAWLIFWFARIFIKPIMTWWPATDRGISVLSRLDRQVDKLLPRPRGVDIDPVTLGGVPSERIEPPRPATDSLAGATILYFHGGAFVFCGLATHRTVCSLLAAKAGVPVYSAAYRQLPDGSIGTSVMDAMAAYTAVLSVAEDPNRVIVAGDSAGGYLAMKVAEIAALRGMTRPAAVIGFSPLLNLNLESHDPDYMKRDAYLPMRQLEKLRDKWLDGPDHIEGAQSPVDADPTLFPPVFFSVAEYEITRPDAEIVTEAIERTGRPIETHIWAGQVHAFPVIGQTLPEARALLDLSIDFARRSVATDATEGSSRTA